MPKLYVVRHSAVNIDYSLPATRWTLSHEGIQLMMPIVESSFWSSVRTIYHSPEPKAAQTAMLIARRWRLPLAVSRGLREMEIGQMVMEREQFYNIVGDHLEGEKACPFIEDFDAAKQRFVRSIAQIVAAHPGQSLGIVSHGRILTAFYGHLLCRRLTRGEWQSIRQPDLSVIDLDNWRIESGFFSNLRRVKD